MNHDHVVVQRPDAPAKQLLLLFHGVGDNPVSGARLGVILHLSFPMRWWSASVHPIPAARRRVASGFRWLA